MFCDITKYTCLEDCLTDKDGLPCCSDPKFVEKMKELLNKMRRNAIKLGFYHNSRYGKYRSALFYIFRLPSLILSGINGFFAIGLQKYISQTTISVTNAVICFVCGIITSVEISLNLQKRMESELDTYKKFYKLTVEIDKELNLFINKDDNDRARLREFVEKRYNDYQSIVSLSNIVTSECMLSEDEFSVIFEKDECKNRKVLHKIRNDTYQIMPNYFANDSNKTTKPKSPLEKDSKSPCDEESQESNLETSMVPFQRSKSEKLTREESLSESEYEMDGCMLNTCVPMR